MKIKLTKETVFFPLGIVFIFAGIICNTWLLARFSPDGIFDFSTKLKIWIIEIFCIAVGFCLIKYRSSIKLPRYREILFSLVTFLLFILLFEGGLRVFYFIKHKTKESEMAFAEYLGWESTPDNFWKRKINGYGEIQYSTTKYGFRVFGDVDSKKTKIFVIGDSFTQGTTVSDGETYYDYLGKNNKDIEIFTYACGGYGSLQEYMILDKYYDVIKPHVILWQFCSNDIINNDFDLESASFRNNNQMRRPYLQDGKIEWLYPKQKSGWLVQTSYLLRLLDIKMNILRAEKYGSIEDTLSNTHPLFIRAAKTTGEIMRSVKKRASAVPIVAFSTDKPAWLGDTYFEICEKNGIHYISGIPEAMEEAKRNGIVIDYPPYDAHWNKNGHVIAGKIILKYFIENKFIHSSPAEIQWE
ncbi:MAG: hypothetical protein B6D35_14705 [Candidatus Brocadia sp. UTAMX2]|jgi:hypothetical protein|nr:MAG: hypothetical protein B6D35_14705 [Candidatus Brocadia sp. UTAMX2]